MEWFFIPMLAVPAALFLISVLSTDELVEKVNVGGSVALIVTGLVTHALYFLSGSPSATIEAFRAEGLGTVYGFVVDPFSMCFAMIVSVVGGCIMLYATEYMSPRNAYHPVTSGKVRFYAWMYLFITAAIGFVFSASLIQMMINFELMTLSCWGLISYYGTPKAAKASYKMLIVTHLGAYGGLAAAAGLSIAWAGSSDLASLAALGADQKLVILGLLMWAAITKSSQFPTYSWLPDAMAAPTPTSALLHGAAMVEMGPYLVARAIYSMGYVPGNAYLVVLVPAVASIAVATLTYPVLRDGKRLLAYSTIAEVGFMFFAVALMALSPALGLTLFLLHFVVHAFIKSTGFLLMGYAGYSLGTHDLPKVMELVGGSRLLTNLYLLTFLGLAGAPIYGVSKIYLATMFAGALTGPGAPLTPFMIALAFILAESLVILAVGVRWFNAVSSPSASGTSLPAPMLASLAFLVVFLYLMQWYFFVAIKPFLGVVA